METPNKYALGVNPDKEYIAGMSLRDFKEYCQRQNQKKDKRIQNICFEEAEPKKQKGLLGHLIELLIAPFRRKL